MHARRINKSLRLLLRRALFVTASIILVAATATTVYALLKHPSTTVTAVAVARVEPQTKTTQKLPALLPVRLSIPSANVDAVVAQAGLTADGTMDIKKNPDQVAWYQFGTHPGDEGSAVIAGHYGWTGQHGSVFNNLSQLKPGDSISTIDQKGTATLFTVRETRKYDPHADAEFIFQSYDHKAHLNLITCDGTWDNATHSFTNRLVVFADLT